MQSLIGKKKGLKAGIFCLLLGLGLIGSFIYGLYLLIVSFQDPHSQEVEDLSKVIALWEEKQIEFKNMTVTLTPFKGTQFDLKSSEIEDWNTRHQDIPSYPHLKYFRNDTLISETYTNIDVIHNPLDLNEYNITANMTLTLSSMTNLNLTNTSILERIVIHKRQKYPLDMKMCDNHNTGYYNGTAHSCYYHFQLNRMCIVINNTNLQVVDWYKDGCEGKGLEEFLAMKWTSPKTPRNFTCRTAVEVRSQYDPYLYVSNPNFSSLPPTQAEYAIIGIVVLVLSILLICIPTAYFCKKKKQKSSLRQFELEMSNVQNFA